MSWTAVRHPRHALVVALAVAALGLTACGSDDGKVALSTIPSYSATESPTPTDPPTLTAPDPTSGPTTAPSATSTPTSSKKATTTRTTTTTRRTTGTSTTTRSTTPTPTPSVSVVLPTVAALLASEAAAGASVASTHVVGSVVTSAGRFGVDMRIGGNADGTLTYASGTIGIRRVGSELYIMGSPAFFTGNGHPELVATHGNKWMHIVAADPAYDNIVPITYVSNWVNMVHAAPATAVKAAMLGTTPMFALTGGSGTKANTVYLPRTGPALPASVTSADGVDKLTFTQWNTGAPSVSTPTGLVDEPDDAVLDVPTFPEETAVAFSAIWMT